MTKLGILKRLACKVLGQHRSTRRKAPSRPDDEAALRKAFNGLRHVIKTGTLWLWVPDDLPPWAMVYQQAQRWLTAGCFKTLAEDLRAVLRLAAGCKVKPSAAIPDSRTLRSLLKSSARAGDDGAKRKQGASCTWPSTRWVIC